MKKYSLYFFFTLFLFSFANNTLAAGATFYLLPANGAFQVGKSFSVKAMVDTVGNKINAGESTIKYDPKFIQIIKINKDKSIFKLWATEPNANSKTGTIKFAGGIPAGNFNGSNGFMFSIDIKPLKNGTSTLSFASSSLILVANGQGINVANQASSTDYYTFGNNKDIEKIKAEIKKLFGKIIIDPTKKATTTATTSAWYIDINEGKRYAIHEYGQAVKMIKAIGIKISSKDIAKYEKTKFPKKSAGKIFIKDGDLKKVIYINPKDLKAYKFTSQNDIISTIKKFGEKINVATLGKIANWKL